MKYYLASMSCVIGLLTITFMASASMENHRLYDFKVFLEDREIGKHRFTVTPAGEKIYVKSEANFDVKVLFISAYSYEHTSNEEWQGDCLRSITATTDDNGDERYVHGHYDNNYLLLSTSVGQQKHEGCVRTYAYWNPEYLSSEQLLNPQTGELEPVKARIRLLLSAVLMSFPCEP